MASEKQKLWLARRWPVRTELERFWSHVQKGSLSECWPWTGYCTPQGYGVFNIRKGKWEYAHRYAWLVHHGVTLFDSHICHHCDNPPCCNPDHLFSGTHLDNMRDMMKKGRHKKRGPGHLSPAIGR